VHFQQLMPSSSVRFPTQIPERLVRFGKRTRANRWGAWCRIQIFSIGGSRTQRLTKSDVSFVGFNITGGVGRRRSAALMCLPVWSRFWPWSRCSAAFMTEDDQPGGNRGRLESRLWQRRFGADPMMADPFPSIPRPTLSSCDATDSTFRIHETRYGFRTGPFWSESARQS
jgi:hypothetical protein